MEKEKEKKKKRGGKLVNRRREKFRGAWEKRVSCKS